MKTPSQSPRRRPPESSINSPFEHDDELKTALVRQRELEHELDLEADKTNAVDMEM